MSLIDKFVNFQKICSLITIQFSLSSIFICSISQTFQFEQIQQFHFLFFFEFISFYHQLEIDFWHCFARLSLQNSFVFVRLWFEYYFWAKIQKREISNHSTIYFDFNIQLWRQKFRKNSFCNHIIDNVIDANTSNIKN